MTDRADEIARGLVLDHVPVGYGAVEQYEIVAKAVADTIAAALRSYGNERLEESAVALERLNVDWAASDAAKLVRSLKSQPERPDKDTGTGE